jgi:hypothetical protein
MMRAGFKAVLEATGSAALPHPVVEAIAVAEQATGPMRYVDLARALAGRGLEGDRYAAKAGTFTPANDSARGYDLTLVEAEVLDDLLQAVPLPVDPFDEPWSTIMTEEQQKAQHALQEAMDRRDNGGETGH